MLQEESNFKDLVKLQSYSAYYESIHYKYQCPIIYSVYNTYRKIANIGRGYYQFHRRFTAASI